MAEQATLTISVAKLAEMLDGEILNASEKSENLIENLMVGAMCVDPAPDYFAVRSNKAVITRGDRADIQLGALQTSTRCLIATGGIKPGAVVMSQAEAKGVPVISVSKSTPDTLTTLEQALGQIVEKMPVSEAEGQESPEDAQPEAAAEG